MLSALPMHQLIRPGSTNTAAFIVVDMIAFQFVYSAAGPSDGARP
jgi:hypothetical protein